MKKGLTKSTVDFINAVNGWLNSWPWYLMLSTGAAAMAALVFFGYIIL